MKPYKKVHEYAGKMYSLTELARLSGIPDSTLYYRMYQRGLTVEQAIAEGRTGKNRGKVYDYRGEMLTAAEICSRTGVPVYLFRERLHKGGWTIEEAAETPSGVPRKVWNGDIELADPNIMIGVPPAEEEKYNLAARIAKLIIPEGAFARFNFRCVTPQREFAFDGDEITYRVRFSADGNKAYLVAWFRSAGDDPPLALCRCFDVSVVGKVKEISLWG